MVQSLNTKALATLAYVLRHPTLLVPHVSVANISELNYTALKDQAVIQAVVFDKDNTLTAPYGTQLHPLADHGLAAAKAVFGVKNVAIMSNSAGTPDDPGYTDALNIEAALGIAVIRHEDKKPGGLDAVLAHFGVEDPTTVCMIGDRLLTDVVFGNLYGMLTVHTLPLCTGPDNARDNTPSKLLRSLENTGLYTNWFGSRWLYHANNRNSEGEGEGNGNGHHPAGRGSKAHKYWAGETAAPLRITLVLDGDDEKDAEADAATKKTVE